MSLKEILMIGGMALVTFGIRYSMFAAGGGARFPAWLENALRFAPAAVLAAIIAPAVLIPPSAPGVALSCTNPYLVAAIIALLLSWFGKNLLLTILVGMASFWAWKWVLVRFFL